MNDIIVTNHALEEFIKDNPNSKCPKTNLRELFKYFLLRCETRQVDKYYKDYVRNAEVIQIWYERIIFNWVTIITYYRTIPLKWEKSINKLKNKVKKILNWKLQEQVFKKARRSINRKQNNVTRKFYKSSKHKFSF